MSHETIEEIEDREWEHTFAINIHAQFYLMKAALPHLKPGSAINTTTFVVLVKAPRAHPLRLDQAAIANSTASLGQLLAEKGTRVNSVAPGQIWPPFIPSTFPLDKVEKFGEDTPMGRHGQPRELAPRLRVSGVE